MKCGRVTAAVVALLILSTGVCIHRSRAGEPRAAPGDVPIPPAKSCTALMDLRIPGTTLSITHASAVAASPAGTVPLGSDLGNIPVALPSHCLVEGVIDAHTGPDGKRYGLRFALALPDAWNRRFLFQGGGGMDGTLYSPLGAQAAGDRPALARGFAVVSTDGGHRGALFDESFLVDQETALDFAFKSVPTVATIAKQVVANYYGSSPVRSYFDGCSTGGREGMEAVERYPSLFDGVISGAPAMRTGFSNIALKWAAVAFNRIAPRNPATGEPVPGGAFSAADRRLIVNGLLHACDALDGLRDGMIFNVKACHFDPVVLECSAAKTTGCLSHAQVMALHTAFGGPVTAGGWRIYAPYPYDTGIAAQPVGPLGIAGFLFTHGWAGALPLAMNLESDVARAVADPEEQLTDTEPWVNLQSFAAHGGKQLFYHGMSDPWFSANETIGYYQRMARANGGLEKARGFVRLFLVPGMSHCRGGSDTLDHFDLLTPLVDWVEHGKAPEAVVATGRSLPGVSRPLCAWPQHAQYMGHGNPNDAESFECRD